MSRERREFLALLDSHGPAAMSMLRRLCGNASDADDAFQDTAVRVWKNLHGRPLLRNPKGWLMTIAYRAFIDQRARRGPHETFVDSPDRSLASPDEAAERSEDRDRLRAAIDRLPETVREVVLLHYSGGLTLSQTAEAMRISPGTAKSRLNAALVKLRSHLT